MILLLIMIVIVILRILLVIPGSFKLGSNTSVDNRKLPKDQQLGASAACRPSASSISCTALADCLSTTVLCNVEALGSALPYQSKPFSDPWGKQHILFGLHGIIVGQKPKK